MRYYGTLTTGEYVFETMDGLMIRFPDGLLVPYIDQEFKSTRDWENE